MQDIVKGFLDNDIALIKESVLKGEDLSQILEKSKEISKEDLTELQQNVLEELHGIKDHGYDLFLENSLKINITPMGERFKRVRNDDNSITDHILITDEEHNHILSDAVKIRDTFIKNNPKDKCMETEQIYYFLLGRYCEEQTEGYYENIVNERLKFSDPNYER